MSKLDWHARRTQIELTALVELRDGVVSSRDLRQTRNVEEGLDRVSETKRARDSANPDVAAWDALMASFQKPLPCAPDQTWVEMERIYALSEQP